MPKVTMQDIADSLGTSRVTVWNAFNNRGGLSEELRTAIFVKAAELGYRKIPSVTPSQASKTIGLIIGQTDVSSYWSLLTHNIAKALSGTKCTLVYIYLPSEYQLGYSLPSSLTDGSIDGCIIISAFDLNILQLLNSLPLPKVYLDTSTMLPLNTVKGDLILYEGEHQIRTITEHIIHKGLRDLAFIGDINYCRSNYDRYLGYLSAMAEYRLPISDASFITKTGKDISAAELERYIESMEKIPEAFICCNDYVASFISNLLMEKGIRIPEDVYITGYDKILDFFPMKEFITTVEVQPEFLSKRLVSQLLFRLENPDSSYERIYIRADVFYGKSTDF